VPKPFLTHRGAEVGAEERSSSSVLHGKRVLFAGASFAIRLVRHAFHVAGYMRTHTMFTRHVTSNVTIDRFHVEWAEWRDIRETAPSTSSSSTSASAESSITFGYTPIRGLFTRGWTTPSDHGLPVGAHVIVADPGLHDVASNTLQRFRENIPDFFRALASVTRHVVLLLPTATHFDMQGVLAYHRCVSNCMPYQLSPHPNRVLSKHRVAAARQSLLDYLSSPFFAALPLHVTAIDGWSVTHGTHLCNGTLGTDLTYSFQVQAACAATALISQVKMH
jgi:hypothetical protein